MQTDDNMHKLKKKLNSQRIDLVAVSKGRPVEQIREAYDADQRDFGENRVQELVEKYELLPKDIRWHMIGHLQKNKVRYIVPFVAMIQSVDSLELLEKINADAQKNNRVIDCLLQIKIAREETKYGMEFEEAKKILESLKSEQNDIQPLQNICIRGLMGMASNTPDQEQIRREFRSLKNFYDEIKLKYFTQHTHCNILSMGMSGDWRIAVEEGSTLVRLGRAIFEADV